MYYESTGYNALYVIDTASDWDVFQCDHLHWKAGLSAVLPAQWSLYAQFLSTKPKQITRHYRLIDPSVPPTTPDVQSDLHAPSSRSIIVH